MSETNNNRCKWLHIRLKEDELIRINKKFSASTCRKLSEYARRVLLDKVITVYTRSESMDDLMAELILLKNELSAIGNNFNQLVKRLHTMDDKQDLNSWLLLNEKHKENFFKKVDEINQKITQLSDQWLQE
jgi:hypothetical protein